MEYFLFILFFSPIVLVQSVSSFKCAQSYLVIFYLFVVFVALIIGLRGNEDEYTIIFIELPTFDTFFEWDPELVHQKGYIFSFIVSFFKTIGLNSQSIFLFFSGGAVLLHGIYYKKFTEYYFLAFMIYLAHEIAYKEFVGLRMGVASVLVLPMIVYLTKNNNYKFWLLVVVSTFIHYVGILSGLLYFLNRKISPSILWGLLIFSIIILNLNIVSSIILWLNQKGYLAEIVANYINYTAYTYDVGLFHPKTIQQMITLTVLILLFGYKKDTTETYNLLFNTYYLSTILLILFSELALFAFRFGGHFYIVEPILITYLIYPFRQKYFVTGVIIIMMLLLSFLNYVILERVEPYDLFVNYPVL